MVPSGNAPILRGAISPYEASAIKLSAEALLSMAKDLQNLAINKKPARDLFGESTGTVTKQVQEMRRHMRDIEAMLARISR